MVNHFVHLMSGGRSTLADIGVVDSRPDVLASGKPVVMGSSHDWYSNEQGYQGRIAFSENGGPWSVYSDTEAYGLRIQVTPIPEPDTAGLLLPGLGLLWRRRRPPDS